MSYIWNRFQNRNTSRDLTTQGSAFDNSRGVFITPTEGQPDGDSARYGLPLFGLFDDGDPEIGGTLGTLPSLFGAAAVALALTSTLAGTIQQQHEEDFVPQATTGQPDEDYWLNEVP